MHIFLPKIILLPKQIANIHWIMKKAKEFQKNIYFCFIDYAKAFDCVDYKKLWKILKEMGIPDHLTCLLRNLYTGQEATVRTGQGTTDWFQIGKGVHQGLYRYPAYLTTLKSESESEVAQSCPTLCDPIDCSLPQTVAYRLLHRWDFPGKSTRVGCHFLLQGIFLTQGLNPGLPRCRQTLYPLNHQGRCRVHHAKCQAG